MPTDMGTQAYGGKVFRLIAEEKKFGVSPTEERTGTIDFDAATKTMTTTDADLFAGLAVGQIITIPDGANEGIKTIAAVQNETSPYVITVEETLIDASSVTVTGMEVPPKRVILNTTGGDIKDTYEREEVADVRPDRQAGHGILKNKGADLSNESHLRLESAMLQPLIAASLACEAKPQEIFENLTLSISIVDGEVILTDDNGGTFEKIEEQDQIELIEPETGGFLQVDNLGVKSVYKSPFTVVKPNDGSGKLVIDNGYPLVAESGITGCRLVRGYRFRNGTSMPNSEPEVFRSFSIETQDMNSKDGTVGDYREYTGVMVSGLSISVADGIVPFNVTFALCGKGRRNPMKPGDSAYPYSTAAEVDPTGNEIVGATTFLRQGHTLTAFKEVSFELSDLVEAGRENGVSEGSDDGYWPSYVIPKTLKPSGTVKVRHTSLDPTRAVEVNEQFPLTIRLESKNTAAGVQSGNGLIIHMPSCMYTEEGLSSAANDGVREQDLPYEAREFTLDNGGTFTVQMTFFDRAAY